MKVINAKIQRSDRLPNIPRYPLRRQLHCQLHQVLEHSRNVEDVRVVEDYRGAALQVLTQLIRMTKENVKAANALLS